jgi:uncharacterized protein
MSHGNWKEMFRAVEENDAELVAFHIKMGVDINYQHPEFLTSALIESIRRNNIDLMLLLLRFGASVELKEAESGKNAVQISQELNYVEMVKILESYLKN